MPGSSSSGKVSPASMIMMSLPYSMGGHVFADLADAAQKHDLDGIAEAFRLAAALPRALFLALRILRFRRGRVLRFSRRGFVSAAVLYRGVRIAAVVPVSAVASRIFPARVIVFGARGARMNGTLVPRFRKTLLRLSVRIRRGRRPAVFPPRRRYCLKTSRNSAWRRASFFPAVGSFDLVLS